MLAISPVVRRLIALLILLIHINNSMFIPVVDEVDMYDHQGNQVGDVNSLIQFMGELLMDYNFSIDTDHDDDRAHFFNLAHHVHPYVCQRPSVEIIQQTAKTHSGPASTRRFKLSQDKRLRKGIIEISVPPPEYC